MSSGVVSCTCGAVDSGLHQGKQSVKCSIWTMVCVHHLRYPTQWAFNMGHPQLWCAWGTLSMSWQHLRSPIMVYWHYLRYPIHELATFDVPNYGVLALFEVPYTWAFNIWRPQLWCHNWGPCTIWGCLYGRFTALEVAFMAYLHCITVFDEFLLRRQTELKLMVCGWRKQTPAKFLSSGDSCVNKYQTLNIGGNNQRWYTSNTHERKQQ